MFTKLTITIPVWLDRIIVIPLLLYRQWKYDCVFRKIPLGDNLYALVSPQDYYWLNTYHWTYEGIGRYIYASRNGVSSKGKITIIRMHRQIMNAPKHLVVDHASGNTIDNRRENLRLATHSQNAINRRRDKSKTTSKYIGVTFKKRDKRWQSRINHNGKNLFLGYFASEIVAAKTYDEAARKYHGEFAKLNFPEKTEIDHSGRGLFLVSGQNQMKKIPRT